MEHINLANIEKFLEGHEQLSSFDIYYLGFVTKYTGQENLETAFNEISAYLELESEGFLTLPDKLQGYVSVFLTAASENSLPEMNKEWLENNPNETKEKGFIEYFNQIHNMINSCDGIMKIELYYIGNFHALDPCTQIETVFSNLQKLAKVRANHTVAKRIEFVCNMFKNKLNSSQRLNVLTFPNQKDRVKLESVKKEGTGIVFGLPKEPKNPVETLPVPQVVSEQKEKQTNVKIESSNVTNATTVPSLPQTANPWYPPTSQTMQDQKNGLSTHVDVFDEAPTHQGIQKENALLDKFKPANDLSSSTQSLAQRNEKELSFGMHSLSSLNSSKNDPNKESPKFPESQRNLENQVKEEAKDPENKLLEPKRIPEEPAAEASSPLSRTKKASTTTAPTLKNQKVQPTSINCFMCERVIEKKNISVILESCQHVCCIDCMEDARCFMHNQIQMRKLPLNCPLESCHKEIQLSDLVNTLREDDDISEEYIKYTLENYIESHDNINCCPTAGCLYAFDKSFENKFTCPLCQKSYCLHCRIDWHEGFACSHRRVKEEDAIQIQKQLKSKKCPKCTYWVIKRQGYKCLICPSGHKFCYDCGAQREEDDCRCFGETKKAPIVNPALFHEIMKTPQRHLDYQTVSEFNSRQELLLKGQCPPNLPKFSSIDILYCKTESTKYGDWDLSAEDEDDISYPSDDLDDARTQNLDDEEEDDYFPPTIRKITADQVENENYFSDDVSCAESLQNSQKKVHPLPRMEVESSDSENNDNLDFSNDISYQGSSCDNE